MNKDIKASLSVQWHITSRCRKRCRHCYMFESERYKKEIENELSFPQMIEILDDINDFENKYGFKVNDFFITGGDPVLNPDYADLLLELKKRGKRTYIMGNPETLTDEVIKNLKKAGIQQMQMSLDGLKKTHDFYRGAGNFDETIRALEILDKNEIIGTIMFTLTGENKDELIPLLNYVAYNTKAKGFAFDLVCGVGNAKNISLQLSKSEVKKYFELYLKEKKKIKESGNLIRISEKSKFFQLLHYENNDFYPYSTDEFSMISGCYVGLTCYTILADGSVTACRRFPSILGKMPEEKMEDIFLKNNLLKKFRRANSFETCGTCMFFKHCRGCPAVTFGYTQDPFSDNPLCFKDLLQKQISQCRWESPSFNTTKIQEAEIIKRMLHNQYSYDYTEFIKNDYVLIMIGTLISDKAERQKFFSSPNEYVKRCNYSELSEKEIAYICYYVECVIQNRIPNPMRYALDM